MTVDVEPRDGRVLLAIADNGPGFPEGMVGVAFEERFSTRGEGRGRGLLEVDDAVRRMSGSVALFKDVVGTPRVVISLPLENA